MRALGLNPSEDDVKKIIDGIDPSGKPKGVGLMQGWGTCGVRGPVLRCMP